MSETEARATLARFDSVIRAVSAGVVERFPDLETDDVEQEAKMLVLSYAGFISGRHFGKLVDINMNAGGTESRILGITSTQLRLDLLQKYGRESDRKENTVSLDSLSEANHPGVSYDDRALDHVDEDLIRKDFPYLSLRYFDGVSERALAKQLGVSLSTISRRTSAEKESFLIRRLVNAGLVVEGDEEVPELMEAYGYVRKAGR